MVARSHPPVVFGAAAVQPNPEKSIVDADLERLKARATRFHTDIQPAVTVSAKHSKPVLGADFDLLNQEEVEKRRQRAQKFGTPLVKDGLQPALTSKQTKAAKESAAPISEAPALANTELTDAELADQAEQRRQTALTAERRPNAVHLHGVHMMTASDCLHFFAEYNPASVEWINDACCNVVFHDADSASKAILGLGAMAPPEEDPDGFGFTEADVSAVLHLWHKGVGYAKGEVDNFPVELLFRLATTADIKQVSTRKQQGGGRGKKTHRGKGKGRGGRGQQKQQQQQKRQFQDVDGDVEMRHRGKRGGKRYRRQKGLAMGVRDVEMQDAEAFDDDPNNHLTNAEVRQAAAYGDASFSRQAYGPGTMFSASAAGAAVTPSFHHYAPLPAQDVRDVNLVDYGDI